VPPVVAADTADSLTGVIAGLDSVEEEPVAEEVEEPRQGILIRVIGWVLGSGPVQFLRRQLLLLLGLAVVIAAAWYALSSVSARQEHRRFLTTTRLSIMDKEVQKACRFVERNFADPALTPERLCEVLVTGESFLETLFERELGMSVSDFIDQVRVNRVKIALRRDPLLPVAELGIEAGFSEPEALESVFRKTAGMSLERYRDALSAGSEPAA
jgi:AraC-like DNA-binding protein